MRERILKAAGGNPLFVEEMAAMVQASDDGEVEVPPTLQALIAARLDHLDPRERSVLERGSVEGEVFHHSVVQTLMPEESRLTSQLTALVRKAKTQFSLLVTVVVLSAVVPTAIAERWFLPDAERERRVDRRLVYAESEEYV
ncbi:MAG: hypothetical protein LC777_18025 [Actinobacteria bacterium]|nr:hypothetical protein [Actinomycetota bacterium]